MSINCCGSSPTSLHSLAAKSIFLSQKVKDLDLVPIANADEATIVVHGTNRRAWQSIKQQVD